ncbi:MAG: hypothetical protein HYR90_00940 [Candidatus Andersenbacteria bacterium]|nr:hypothetical protein [Candidatus Andersenbacteria bacterium]MBI3251185.1 hypothetical protein [Candidatus Andersenbacteria bacterium]
MKRVKPVTIRLTYAADPDSQDYALAGFALLFSLARKELQKERASRDAGTPTQSYHPDAPKVDNTHS